MIPEGRTFMIFRRWGGGSGIYGQNSDGRGWLQGGEGEVIRRKLNVQSYN